MPPFKQGFVVEDTKQFIINFNGLAAGKHQFVFNIDDTFFEHFEYSEIHKGQIKVELELTKELDSLILDFSIDGITEVSCDRCLEPLEFPLHGNNRLYVKFSDNNEEETDEVVILPPSSYQLDVSQYIYEFTHLMLPIRRVHPEDEHGKSSCNEEVIRKLEQYLKKEESDSRWDDLQKLIN
ncbi:MAG: DUF177 domain-containing protein [Bacteroidota bacterium]